MSAFRATAISGSITRTIDGKSYIEAGTNVTVVSQSDGSLLISSNAEADLEASYLVVGVTSSLPNERMIETGSGIIGTDGGAGASYTISIDDSVVATVTGAIGNPDTVYWSNGTTASWNTNPIVTSLSASSYIAVGTGSLASDGQIRTSDDPWTWKARNGDPGTGNKTLISYTGGASPHFSFGSSDVYYTWLLGGTYIAIYAGGIPVISGYSGGTAILGGAFKMYGNQVYFGGTYHYFETTTVAPVITQLAHADTPHTMTIAAQSVTAGTGSNLDLKSGTSTLRSGSVNVYAGAAIASTFSQETAAAWAAAADGYVAVVSGSGTYLSYKLIDSSSIAPGGLGTGSFAPGAENAVLWSNGSTTSWNTNPIVTSLSASSYVAAGAAKPATDGEIRLPTVSSIKYRNAADTADLSAISTAVSNHITVGNATGGLYLQGTAFTMLVNNYMYGQSSLVLASSYGGTSGQYVSLLAYSPTGGWQSGIAVVNNNTNKYTYVQLAPSKQNVFAFGAALTATGGGQGLFSLGNLDVLPTTTEAGQVLIYNTSGSATTQAHVSIVHTVGTGSAAVFSNETATAWAAASDDYVAVIGGSGTYISYKLIDSSSIAPGGLGTGSFAPGADNTVLWSSGSSASWTGAPTLSTSLSFGTNPATGGTINTSGVTWFMARNSTSGIVSLFDYGGTVVDRMTFGSDSIPLGYVRFGSGLSLNIGVTTIFSIGGSYPTVETATMRFRTNGTIYPHDVSGSTGYTMTVQGGTATAAGFDGGELSLKGGVPGSGGNGGAVAFYNSTILAGYFDPTAAGRLRIGRASSTNVALWSITWPTVNSTTKLYVHDSDNSIVRGMIVSTGGTATRAQLIIATNEGIGFQLNAASSVSDVVSWRGYPVIHATTANGILFSTEPTAGGTVTPICVLSSSALAWNSNLSSVLIKQDDAGSSTHGKTSTLQAQNAITAGYNGGTLALVGGAPGAGGTIGRVTLQPGGTGNFVTHFGYAGAPTAWGAFYMLAAATAPSDTNHLLVTNGASVNFNAPSAAGAVNFMLGNSQVVVSANSTTIALGSVTASWASTISSPRLTQADAGADANGQTLTVQAQNAITPGYDGGPLDLKGGVSGGTSGSNGSVRVYAGASLGAIFSEETATSWAAASDNYVAVVSGSGTYISYKLIDSSSIAPGGLSTGSFAPGAENTVLWSNGSAASWTGTPIVTSLSASSYVQIAGPTHPTTGHIRLPHGGTLYSVSADGTTNKKILDYGAFVSDRLQLGSTDISIGYMNIGSSWNILVNSVALLTLGASSFVVEASLTRFRNGGVLYPTDSATAGYTMIVAGGSSVTTSYNGGLLTLKGGLPGTGGRAGGVSIIPKTAISFGMNILETDTGVYGIQLGTLTSLATSGSVRVGTDFSIRQSTANRILLSGSGEAYQIGDSTQTGLGNIYGSSVVTYAGVAVIQTVNSGGVAITENLSVGTTINPSYRAVLYGIGSTSSTYQLTSYNSSGFGALWVRDDGLVSWGGSTSSHPVWAAYESGGYSVIQEGQANGLIIQATVGDAQLQTTAANKGVYLQAAAAGGSVNVRVGAGLATALSMVEASATARTAAVPGYVASLDSNKDLTWLPVGSGSITAGADNTVFWSSGGAATWTGNPVMTRITAGAYDDPNITAHFAGPDSTSSTRSIRAKNSSDKIHLDVYNDGHLVFGGAATLDGVWNAQADAGSGWGTLWSTAVSGSTIYSENGPFAISAVSDNLYLDSTLAAGKVVMRYGPSYDWSLQAMSGGVQITNRLSVGGDALDLNVAGLFVSENTTSAKYSLIARNTSGYQGLLVNGENAVGFGGSATAGYAWVAFENSTNAYLDSVGAAGDAYLRSSYGDLHLQAGNAGLTKWVYIDSLEDSGAVITRIGDAAGRVFNVTAGGATVWDGVDSSSTKTLAVNTGLDSSVIMYGHSPGTDSSKYQIITNNGNWFTHFYVRDDGTTALAASSGSTTSMAISFEPTYSNVLFQQTTNPAGLYFINDYGQTAIRSAASTSNIYLESVGSVGSTIVFSLTPSYTQYGRANTDGWWLRNVSISADGTATPTNNAKLLLKGENYSATSWQILSYNSLGTQHMFLDNSGSFAFGASATTATSLVAYYEETYNNAIIDQVNASSGLYITNAYGNAILKSHSDTVALEAQGASSDILLRLGAANEVLLRADAATQNIGLFEADLGTLGYGSGQRVLSFGKARVAPTTGIAGQAYICNVSGTMTIAGDSSGGLRLRAGTTTIAEFNAGHGLISFFGAPSGGGGSESRVIFIGEASTRAAGENPPTGGLFLYATQLADSDSGASGNLAWVNANGNEIEWTLAASTTASAGTYSVPDTCVRFVEVYHNGTLLLIPGYQA